METTVKVYTKENWEFKNSILVMETNGRFFTHESDNEFFKDIDNPDFRYQSNEIEVTQAVIDAFMLTAVEIQPLITVYYREQFYGGAEGGGWYYHNQKATNYTHEQVELKVGEKESNLDSHGEGFMLVWELFEGEYEDTKKPYYC